MEFFKNPFGKLGKPEEPPKEMPLNEKPGEGIIVEPSKEKGPTAPNAPMPEAPKTEGPLPEEIFPKK